MRIVPIFIVGVLASAAGSASANPIVDGSFERQATLQGNPYAPQPSGEKFGAGWTNWGWSSWQDNFSGAWMGGAIARTEDFTTGWKWARTGDVFGIIKDRQTMSQTFVATEGGIGTLSWHDANRSSWREHSWFGRPNQYSVAITDAAGHVQHLGTFTSQVFNGLESNSWSNTGDDRFSLAGKQGWFPRTGASFTLLAGMTYTLSFNSLSPYIHDASGAIVGVDDRTTLLDDISLSVIPAPGSATLIGLGGILCTRRRRVQVA